MRVLIVIGALVVGLFAWTDVVKADQIFKATLTGDQEVPAVNTVTIAKVKIRLNDLWTAGEFSLTVNDGVRARQAHIHCGQPGENGPIIVWLAGNHDAGWDIDGEWVSNATFTEENVVNRTSPCGATLAELFQAMWDGRTYANVHTAAHPGGEVRGQLQGQ
jgi:hypothetical protein